MERRSALLVAMVCLGGAFASACGGSKSLASQLAPSGSVTLTSVALTLNPPPVGSGAQATATATFSNGTVNPIASGFGTDTPSVATVTSTGGVAGLSIGDVTIFVDYQGMRATKKVRILPGYGGIFIGSYTIGSCAATGGFISTDPAQDFCTVFATGLTPGIAFNNIQSADLTTMTGQFILGGLQGGTGTGTISSAGLWNFAGTLPIGTGRVELRSLAATSPAVGKIAGSFQLVFTDTTLTGSGTVNAINLDATRQGSSAAMAISTAKRPASSDWRSLILEGIR
jgi:hypothetical protein